MILIFTTSWYWPEIRKIHRWTLPWNLKKLPFHKTAREGRWYWTSHRHPPCHRCWLPLAALHPTLSLFNLPACLLTALVDPRTRRLANSSRSLSLPKKIEVWPRLQQHRSCFIFQIFIFVHGFASWQMCCKKRGWTPQTWTPSTRFSLVINLAIK